MKLYASLAAQCRCECACFSLVTQHLHLCGLDWCVCFTRFPSSPLLHAHLPVLRALPCISMPAWTCKHASNDAYSPQNHLKSNAYWVLQCTIITLPFAFSGLTALPQRPSVCPQDDLKRDVWLHICCLLWTDALC